MRISIWQLKGVILVFILLVASGPILGTQSNLAFGTQGARLTGKIFGDEGTDQDGDLLFDWLKIGVQVNVTDNGMYTVSVSGLTGDNWNYISVSNSTQVYLEVGLRVVNVTLNGNLIYISGINASSVSNIYLYGQNGTYLDYAYNLPLSHQYSYRDFDPPGASLTGSTSDKAIDTDYDGYFNVLEIGVEVNVTESGRYDVSVSGLLDSSYNYISVYNSSSLHLNPGIHNFSMQLSGLAIRMSGFNPSNVSYIYLRDIRSADIGHLYRVPLSKMYSYLGFEPPKAILTGNVYDAGVDSDGDGKFNYLSVGVEISVSEPVSCSVGVYYLRDSSLNKTIDVQGYQSSYLTPGVHVINVSLYGPSIFVSSLNPRYVSQMNVYSDYSDYKYDVPLSRQYSYTEFDPPGAIMTGKIFDSGVDSDGDGRFNYLQVGFEINVTDAGLYTVYFSGLLNSTKGQLPFYYSQWQKYLDKGLQVVSFSLEGMRIRVAGFNPRYVDFVSIQDQDYHYLSTLDDILLSREYSYAEFDEPPAKLTSVVYDVGEDTDGDGAFNYLKVGVEINVSDAGYYQIEVSQLRDSGGNYIGVYASAGMHLEAGIQVLNVSLDGLTIYLSGRNPSSIGFMVLRDQNQTLANLYDTPLSREYLHSEFEPPGAVLTGVIFDQGVDTDNDGTYDYLQIGVQVNVTDAGYYQVSANGLWNSNSSYRIYVGGSNRLFLNVGLEVVYLYFDGPTIYLSHANPRYVDSISLQGEKSSFYDSINHVPLSREYSYTEFDAPAAMLTGKIYDRGVDTDGDGTFNYLEISIEINVTKPINVQVSLSHLRDSRGNYIWIYGSQQGYLDVGLQRLNVSLDGYRIRSSGINPRFIDSIYLYSDYSTSMNNVPLSREYLRTEFEAAALLTGVISDQGVDNDADGFVEYLEVQVQINVLDPDTYIIYISQLEGENADSSNGTGSGTAYVYVWDSKTTHLNAGIQTVSLYLYGPQIRVSHVNPINVSYISLQNKQYTFQDSFENAPLSRKYSYTEFDAPLADVETKFVVYPDGRVAVEGQLKYTNMIPKYTGPTAAGFFNLSRNGDTTQASTGLTVQLPPEIESQFPFNSTMLNLLGTYSNGLVNVGINSTAILPQVAASQFPFNTTDFSLDATYSGGMLNVGINGNTTLPPLYANQFPFNATDLTVVASYANNVLNGRITFDVLSGFPFDDTNVDFSGNRTDLTLRGNLTIVFGIPYGSFIIRNSTDLDQLIDQFRDSFLGERGIVWNATGGLLNGTNFYTNYSLSDSWGAELTFEIDVHGDFVRALAYLMSRGRNDMLVYPVVDEAYSSAQSGSLWIQYNRASKKAAVKLSFTYDLKSLLDYALTSPPGTKTYVMLSSSMFPTMMPGDVVSIEQMTNASDITAQPTDGDIIGFYNPYYGSYYYPRYVVIHRAVEKTFLNGTWYFKTQGDNNYSPDYWTGPDTLDGMISSKLLIGKVVRRVPLLGYLVYPSYYAYWMEGVETPLWLWDEAISSVQEVSVQLAYASKTKQFDIKLTFMGKLKALIDEITRTLPQSWLEGTPPEIKDFVEQFLNTTYASVSSAEVSLSYKNGEAEFGANATIEGDLNAELNHIKDIYFRLIGTSYRNAYAPPIPPQLIFINQTKVDVDNFRISAKLDETSMEGKIEGLTLLPPTDVLNATNFKLERLFNLTAPQYPWQREFPELYQKLGITIEGGSNATHTVTLFRPTTVPEPDVTAPYAKSMTWFNTTLSSLKNMTFQIQPIEAVPSMGTLSVSTTPVSGAITVVGVSVVYDSESWGTAPQSRLVPTGTYNVSFGSVRDYYTPQWQLVTVSKDTLTTASGVYTRITGKLTITTTPVSGVIFVNGSSWGTAPQSRTVPTGTYTVSFGAREGVTTPADQTATVSENTETKITGVYQSISGTVVTEILEPEGVNSSNPCEIDATGDTDTYLTIWEISDPVTIIVKNVTKTADIEPPQGTWEFLGNFVQITVNDTGVSVNAEIVMYYTVEQLQASGLNEDTLTINYWNATSNQWIPVDSEVNKEEHYVVATITHFSLWAVLGQPISPVSLTWILIGVAATAAIIIAVAAVYVKRKKPKTHPELDQ